VTIPFHKFWAITKTLPITPDQYNIINKLINQCVGQRNLTLTGFVTYLLNDLITQENMVWLLNEQLFKFGEEILAK